MILSQARLTGVGLDPQKFLEPGPDDLAYLVAIVAKARGAGNMPEFIEASRKVLVCDSDKLTGVKLETNLGDVLMENFDQAVASLPSRREQATLLQSTPRSAGPRASASFNLPAARRARTPRAD